MEASILIVTKNRKQELEKTIQILEGIIDVTKHEMLVFLDGCEDDTASLQTKYPWIDWIISDKSLGASKARHILYKKAKGQILFGFDDDAHPLQADFIQRAESIFEDQPKTAIIAFKEIKGIFEPDTRLQDHLSNTEIGYLCREFVGCGFAIRSADYNATNGFPEWMDIYGEEVCVSLEILDMGKDIYFTNEIAVNHRVDKLKRQKQGKNKFRFNRQLINSSKYFLVYYKNPTKPLAKLYWHNLKKYAFIDFNWFRLYLRALLKSSTFMFSLNKWRNPVQKSTLTRKKTLPLPGGRAKKTLSL